MIDATLGGGGHARLFAERLGPDGLLIGVDQDESMLALARQRLQGLPVRFVHGSFADIGEVLEELALPAVDAVLADLGISSDQLDDPARGLTFQVEGPLDMRMDRSRGEPAGDLVNRLSERELADIFWRYGEERFSRRIARRIVEARQRGPLETTLQLAELVRRCIPRPKGRRHGIDPATRVFQALRIAVNGELDALERFLAGLPACLKPGGRAAVISFHSLEDRLVKQAFRNREVFEQLTRKPVVASDEEIRGNPRSRSAKLRVARRLDKTP
jgi:16S rRNA (cytosine1402-N4)-methyltransferase